MIHKDCPSPAPQRNCCAKLAKDNGQTTNYSLEQAAKHYIRLVAPTQSVARPEITAHVRRLMNKNRKLFQLLAH